MSLADFQRRMADALTSPGATFADVDPDGFEVAALLVAKLRFERLVQGSSHVARWFDVDPEGFVAAFRE